MVNFAKAGKIDPTFNGNPGVWIVNFDAIYREFTLANRHIRLIVGV